MWAVTAYFHRWAALHKHLSVSTPLVEFQAKWLACSPIWRAGSAGMQTASPLCSPAALFPSSIIAKETNEIFHTLLLELYHSSASVWSKLLNVFCNLEQHKNCRLENYTYASSYLEEFQKLLVRQEMLIVFLRSCPNIVDQAILIPSKALAKRSVQLGTHWCDAKFSLEFWF